MRQFKLFSIAVTFVVLAWAALPGQSRAQDAASLALKIAIVNVDAIRVQSAAYKKANAQFIEYSKEVSTELQKEDTALREIGAELNRKRTLLSPEAFAEENKNFKQRVAEFQRKVQERQKQLSQTQADVTNQINRKIIEIVSNYAKANNVTLVLPEALTILRDEAMVINDDVLKELDKAMPSVEVKAPAK